MRETNTMKKAQIVGLTLLASITITIAQYEGLEPKPYIDIAGKMTVCYGHTENVKNREYSKSECDALLTKDVKKWFDEVERCQPNLPPRVKAAFTSASFNLGSRIICNTKTSTAARLLKARDYHGACKQLPRWNKARDPKTGRLEAVKGLTIRRNKEMELCLQGVSDEKNM